MQVLLQTVQKLRLFSKILASNLILIGSVYADSIGDIREHTGSAALERQSGEEIVVSDASLPDVEMNDTAITGNGRMLIEFKDEEELALTEHTRIYIDEVYYDPDPSLSKMTMRMALGTARFTSGTGARIDKANVDISTPTAQIGIRGTDFTTTVDELGRTLVVLLPDKTGKSSGEIFITNAGGTITLNEAYQSMMLQSYDVMPQRTVILEGITPDSINNMFIVNPPKEIKEVERERESKEDDTQGILDIDFLAYDALEDDALEDKEELEYTELDINLLDVEFLQDLLDITAELDKINEIDREVADTGNINIEGTQVGFDEDSQYNTFINKEEETIVMTREVEGIIRITHAIYTNAVIETYTNQKPSEITLGDGSQARIIIIQE